MALSGHFMLWETSGPLCAIRWPSIYPSTLFLKKLPTLSFAVTLTNIDQFSRSCQW